MTNIEKLLDVFGKQVSIPWDPRAAPEEKVWFCVYDPSDERRLLRRIDEFALATERAGHGWLLIDMFTFFDEWCNVHPYREEFFKNPTRLKSAEKMFLQFIIERLSHQWDKDDNSKIIAISGTGALFGIIRLSKLIEEIVRKLPIPGRLLVFFPGSHRGYCYQFMNDHDGWNYKAFPIEVKDEDE